MAKIQEKIKKKLKELEIVSKIKGLHFLSGNYRSVFKGSGYDFSELREYYVGDPIKNIDWKKYTIYNKPFTKLYEDERQRKIYFLVDIKPTMDLGFSETKREMSAEFLAYLTHTSLHYKDKVSLILFDKDILYSYPPSNFRNETMMYVDKVLTTRGNYERSNWKKIFQYIGNIAGNNFILFIISDFSNFPPQCTLLNYLQSKGDVIGIYISHLDDIPKDIRDNFPLLGKNNSVFSYSFAKKMENDLIKILEHSFNVKRFSFISAQTNGDALLKLKDFFIKRTLI